MKIDWSTYRITLALYAGVVLILAGFYITYASFDELNHDSRALSKLYVASDILLREKNTDEIEKIFRELKPWVKENNNSSFYIASGSLEKEFNNLEVCLKKAEEVQNHTPTHCYKLLKSFIFSVNNMIILKQNRINNIFYINFAISMGLLILLVFFIRIYIYQQVNKKALIDFKTKLYTRDYLLATMKELCSRQNRTHEKLSALCLKAENITDKEYLLEHIGSAFIDVIRGSDIACRYGENEFIIVFPNTQVENLDKVIKRIDANLVDIKYKVKVLEYDGTQSYDEFVDELVNI